MVKIKGDIDTIAMNIWESLNDENKVSLVVRTIELKTGEMDTRIMNKNDK